MGAVLTDSAPTDVILITGGSRGLGRALVEALTAGPEARVAFTWNAEEGAAREVAAPPGARPFRLDLRDRDRPDDLVAEVEAALGPLAALVNNGGPRRGAPLPMTSRRPAG